MSPEKRVTASNHPSRRAPLPTPDFSHLQALTGPDGLWEHAQMFSPRPEHGYCTEDNARALVVVSQSIDLGDIAAIYLRFVIAARTASGGFHNRKSEAGVWTDDIGSDDSQGRAWWGLGAAARFGTAEWMRRESIEAFDTCDSFQSPHLRANAYAALGAADLLVAAPGHVAATDLLARTSGLIASAAKDRIPWPEVRLTYDNARLPEALLAAGTMLGNRRLIAVGIRLLEWLIKVETAGDHFSFTPSVGWVPGEPRPGFDQQPIEAWAMAAACRRALTITGDSKWSARASMAGDWLMGHNDTGMALYDPSTGATADGLMENSVNENRGAESTLAGIATLQIATRSTIEKP